MVSIFSSLDISEFWMTYSFVYLLDTEGALFTGPLQCMSKSGKISHNYRLTPNAIIELDTQSSPVKLAYINWRIFSPFYEEAPSGNSYGFTIGSEAFYVDSEPTLNVWMGHLRALCIFSTFDEDFVVIKECGKGSTSTVYLVEEVTGRKQYAAKCITKQYLSEHSNAIVNLVHEIKVLSRIEHYCIASLHYIYETANCIYLITEYFPHGNLYQRIKKKKIFSEDSCVSFAKNLLDVLAYMHSRNIVHRDLKPENIMMTSENDYDFKLVDFGLAYEEQGPCQDRCGSPGYIAPEILKRGGYTSKVDIFSAGVILYIIVVGRHPFNDSTPEKILKKNEKCEYQIDGLASGFAKDFIKAMMSPNPAERPHAFQLYEYPWIFQKRRGSVCSIICSVSTKGGSVCLDV